MGDHTNHRIYIRIRISKLISYARICVFIHTHTHTIPYSSLQPLVALVL